MGNVDVSQRAEFPPTAGGSETEQLLTFEQRADFGDDARAVRSDLAISPDGGLPEQETEADPPPRPAVTVAQFCEALSAAAEANDLPVSFFARLIWQESQFKFEDVSEAGAQGVAQFMPATAAEVGLDDPFDPLKALPASARLLRKLRDELGNIGLAAAAYNAGAGRIQNWLARRGSLPDETRTYVRRITGNAAEDWTAEARRIEVPRELPGDAPCAGVGGLTRAKALIAMPVALAPPIRALLEKVRLAEAAARKKAAEARFRLASKARKGTTLARATTGQKLAHARALTRVASAEH
jgi:hypothetical protein